MSDKQNRLCLLGVEQVEELLVIAAGKKVVGAQEVTDAGHFSCRCRHLLRAKERTGDDQVEGNVETLKELCGGTRLLKTPITQRALAIVQGGIFDCVAVTE